MVVSVNGRPVRNASSLRNAVGLMQVGDRVSLGVVRKGWLGAKEKLTVNAKLAGEVATSARSSELTNPRLGGASFEEIPVPAYSEVQGVLVREVERGSRAWANGLRPGDIIMSVNQRPVSDLKDFLELVNKEESALLLHVLRGTSRSIHGREVKWLMAVNRRRCKRSRGQSVRYAVFSQAAQWG